MKKTSLKVNLDPDQLEWLRQQAQFRRCSLAQVIRTLIAEAQREQPEIQ